MYKYMYQWVLYSRKIWWIGLNQREQKYWRILIWQMAKFNLATLRICRMHIRA